MSAREFTSTVPPGVCLIHGAYAGPFCPRCSSAVSPPAIPNTSPGPSAPPKRAPAYPPDIYVRLATRFSFETGDPRAMIEVELTCRAGDGPHKPAEDTWAVRWLGFCLDLDGAWVREPIPSSRDQEFLERTRWARDEAIQRASVAAAIEQRQREERTG